MQIYKSITVSLWVSLLALMTWACSEGNFSGSSGTRRADTKTTGDQQGIPGGGQGIDAADGNTDAGSNTDAGGDGNSDGADGDDADGGSDGDDADQGDDSNGGDLGFEGGEDSLSLREDGTIEIHKTEDQFRAEFRYETDSGWSQWIAATEQGVYPKLCHKFKDTYLEMRVDGGKEMSGWISPPHADISNRGSSGYEIRVGVEDGGCAISFLCDANDFDFEFTLSCPQSDVIVDGLN